MREHQIVISLKPEQFQEVQKQARAAGAQSVGAFVRQNLLIFLGLEEAENSRKSSQMAPSVQADPDWRFIAGELRRLHRELKVLSSEATASNTLVTDIVGATSGGPLLASTVGLAEPYSEPVIDTRQPAAQENFLTDGAPVTADDFPDALEDSLILPPAHGITGGGTTPFFSNPTIPGRSTFGLPMPAGQLPLGSPFSHHTFMPNIAPLPSDLGMTAQTPARQEFSVDEGDVVETTKIEAPPPEPQSLAQPVETPINQSAQSESTPKAEMTLAPEAPQAAQPVSPPDSNEPDALPPASEQPVIPAPPRPQTPAQPNAQHPGAFAPQKDDMEVLADRAFAISPRLGAIEPEVTLQPAPTRSFADTLEELLDAGLINQVLSQNDDDPSNQYAGEVEAPPEDDLVQVIVQEVDIPSADATDSETVEESDNASNPASEEEEPEQPRVVQHEPPPPPRPIGGDDTSNEDEPPKPPPRRRKLM
ncbi:MAG: hypothetical protein K2Y39_16685 [Candidatus Obscuribacterales bacterium]|nr:hypothetical protein [Candidatus Obscuribacterales bacterium]